MAEARYEQTEREYRRSMELNPSLADVRANWASTANRLGMPEEGIASVRLAVRLNPNFPVWYLWFRGAALFGGGRFPDVVETLRTAPAHTVVSRLYLAAAFERVGSHDEARAHVEQARADLPGLSAAVLERIETYRDPADQARLAEPLLAAGLPRT